MSLFPGRSAVVDVRYKTSPPKGSAGDNVLNRTMLGEQKVAIE